MPRPLWDQRGRRSTPQYPCVCSTPCALALVFLHALVYGPTPVVRARHAHVDRSFVLSPFQSQRNVRPSISGGRCLLSLSGIWPLRSCPLVRSTRLRWTWRMRCSPDWSASSPLFTRKLLAALGRREGAFHLQTLLSGRCCTSLLNPPRLKLILTGR